jgi:subtilisin family serine protease
LTTEERRRILSNDYIDVLIEYNRFDRVISEFSENPLNIIDTKYGVFYAPASMTSTNIKTETGYALIPKLYGLLDTLNLEDMGVKQVQNLPNLRLSGQGVIIGIVDTGIDYTNPIFMNEDNTTRIIQIWDQSIENLENSANNFNYGTVYTREQINEALSSEDPYSIVPSRDENGHGTMIAGIAGGKRNEENDFEGVAQQVEFIIVKLKPAKQNLKDYFFIPSETICFQENDIMAGLTFMTNLARSEKKPIAICLGLGSNQGPHVGFGALDSTIVWIANNTGNAVIVAAGNEGNSKHHYYGNIKKDVGYDTVELRVGEGEKGVTMEVWGSAPATYSIDILSPSGEYIPQIVARLGENREIRFLFDNTLIYIDYLLVEAQSGDPLILLRVKDPSPGIWRFRIYAAGQNNTDFHVWLPMTGFITEGTYFIQSNPDTTITSPGNSRVSITVAAYNSSTDSIYLQSSRGYTRYEHVKPDVAAPGVDVLGPTLDQSFSRFSGTSVAAAHVTGVAAMIFEWGIVKGNYTTISGIQMQRFLIRGVNQDSELTYPNKIWGYGTVDIYNTFLSLRSGQ